MTEYVEQRWKDIDTSIPSLLPLQAVPQEPDPAKILSYLQTLHNYMSGDRQSLVRSLNVLSRFRLIQTDRKSDTSFKATGSGALKVSTEDHSAYFDDISESGSGAEWHPLIPAYCADTSEPTGFVLTNEDTNITISGGNLTITPTGTNYSFYVNGRKFTKTSDSISLASATTEGNWFIYYNSSGTLVLDDTVTAEEIIRDNCFVAELYHDGTDILFLMDERHGLQPWQSHLWEHITAGTIRRSGFGLSGLTVDQSGNSDADAEATAVAGIMMDEDLTHSLAAQTSTWQCLYLDTGVWAFEETADTAPLLYAAGPTPQYNDISVPGSESLANVGSNKFFLSHIFATNIVTDGQGVAANGHVAIIGQAEYLTKTAARDGANTEISNLITGVLPMPEFLPVGTIIYQNKGSNQYSAAAVSTDSGEDYVSWIGAEIQPGTPPSAHPNLTLRDDPNQHPADSISCDTSAFGGILSATETEVQAALDAIDDHTHSYLPLAGGNLTGSLFIDKAASPALQLREGGDTADRLVLSTTSSIASLLKYNDSGQSLIRIDAIPSDGIGNALIQLFRTTNTTGAVQFNVYGGDGTSTIEHQLLGDGNAGICKTGGLLTLGGPIRVEYRTSAPSSLANGMIWMESDGLHIYYSGAEKVVAGV